MQTTDQNVKTMKYQNPDKQYHTSDTTVYSCQYHIIFTTKYRRKLLQDEAIQNDFKQLTLAKQDEWHYTVIEMETMPDHVHLLLDIDPTQTNPIQVTSRIKGYTAHELRDKYPTLKTRAPSLWTRSKFISTVGTVSLAAVKRYIETQKTRQGQD